MTAVVNVYHFSGGRRQLPPDWVYIGRGSPWGNPHVIGYRCPACPAAHRVHSRREAIAAFRALWYSEIYTPLRNLAMQRLVDKQLGCYCSPSDCHGDVIAEFVNSGGVLVA